MALSEPYEFDAVSISTSPKYLSTGTTTPGAVTTNGIFHIWVDPVEAAVTKGDYFRVKVYEKCLSGGTQRVVMSQVIGAVGQAEVWVGPPLMLKHGWDFSIEKVAGTDRSWDASVRGQTATITEAYSLNAVSISTTEISIVSGTSSLQTITDDGIYQLFVDPIAASMGKGDEFEIRIYEKVEGTGGTKRQVFEATLMDVQTELFVSPMFQLINGWDMTLKKISGTDRSFTASIRKVT